MATKKDNTQNADDKMVCQFCGKPITSENALEHEAGGRCQSLREQGWDSQKLREHRASMSAEDVPQTEDGRPYVKVAVLHKRLVKEGIPVARMVRAMGGDRAVGEILHEKFEPVYVGRARYLHPDCMTEWGFNFLRNLPGRSSGKNGATEELAAELAK